MVTKMDEMNKEITTYDCIAKHTLPDQSQADSHHGRN